MVPYPRNRRVEIFWNLCLFFALVSVLVPLQPLMPGETFDDSWPTALSQALAQGLIFGREITFTFGPLVSLYTWTYHPFTDSWMVAITLVWAICFCWVLSSLLLNCSGKQKILWLIFILGFLGLGESRFSFLPIRPDAIYFAYPFLLFVYLLSSSFNISQKKSEPCPTVMAFFLSLPLGVFPLIKFSNFLICASLIVLTTMALIFSGRIKSALLFLLGPILSFLLMLWILGQPLSSLPNFLETGFSISSSYTASMSITEGPRTHPVIFVFVAFLLLLAVLKEAPWSLKGKVFLLPAFFLFLFMSFKAGFTRADSVHVPMSGQALLIAAMVGALISQSKRMIDVSVLTFLAGLILVGEYRSINPLKNTHANLASLKNGLKTRLTKDESLATEYQNVLSQLQKKNKLSKMPGPTDIFSTGQTLLIASGNQWAPRPVLQSYKTINPFLSELDKKYFLSDRAPLYLLYKVEPIDNRLASLEDSASWPILLNRYEETGIESGYLKLRTKENAGPEPEPVKLKSGQAQLHQIVRIPHIAKPLFLRLFLKPTFRGKLESVFYKPEELFLQVTLKGQEPKKFRLPHEMAQGGFLIFPLIQTTEDLRNLFAKEAIPEELNVESFEILCEGACASWNSSFELEFYHYKGLM